MAYTFTTKHGSTYVVENGRLLRRSDHDIRDVYENTDVLTIRRIMVLPKVGVQAEFDTLEIGKFQTSVVESVLPVRQIAGAATIEAYDEWDLFGDNDWHIQCRHGGERYATRFGDICCEHDVPVAWAPSLVSRGLYGDHTDEWIDDRRQSAGSTIINVCRRTLLERGDCVCSN